MAVLSSLAAINLETEKKLFWEKQAAEFRSFMAKINPGRGSKNCNRCALALDDILSSGLPAGGIEAIKAVSTHRSDLFTKPVYSDGCKEIIRSTIDDPRFVNRFKVYTADELFDLSGDKDCIELDHENPHKKRAVKLVRSSHETILEHLQTTPARQGITGKTEGFLQAKTAYGFLVLTHLDGKDGHIINWFRDAYNQIYFLDAQSYAKPENFVRRALPEGFRSEVYYICSTPPERSLSPVKAEESKEIKESQEAVKIKEETPETQIASSSTILLMSKNHFSYDIGALTSAAEKGDVNAQCKLASISPLIGLPKVLLDRFHRLSAEKGEAAAQTDLAVCLYRGQGYPKSVNKAARLWTLAAEKGDANAQCNLAFCYMYGEGLAKNCSEGARFFTLSANNGYVIAQRELAYCYCNGLGLSKNAVEAVRFWTLAAEKGDVIAQRDLAACYYIGEGVEKNTGEAVRLWTLAAEKGDIIAQNNLALCFYTGEGVVKNIGEAIRRWTLSANKGYANAQYNLACRYYHGQGVAQNLNEAFRWCSVAAKTGHNEARDLLEKICIQLRSRRSQHLKEIETIDLLLSSDAYATAPTTGQLGFKRKYHLEGISNIDSLLYSVATLLPSCTTSNTVAKITPSTDELPPLEPPSHTIHTASTFSMSSNAGANSISSSSSSSSVNSYSSSSSSSLSSIRSDANVGLATSVSNTTFSSAISTATPNVAASLLISTLSSITSASLGATSNLGKHLRGETTEVLGVTEVVKKMKNTGKP